MHESPTDPVIYVALDCEASGPVPGLYNLVSLGAVPVVKERSKHKVLDDELYLEFKPVFPGFQREAMGIHGITKRHLMKEGVDPKEGMKILRRWAMGLRRTPEDRLVFVGHNAPFDWMYISYYFTWAKVRNPFGYKALDTKALAMGKLDIPWLATNKNILEEYMPEIGNEDMSQKHRADYDARFQARILVSLLDYKKGKPRPRKKAKKKR